MEKKGGRNPFLIKIRCLEIFIPPEVDPDDAPININPKNNRLGAGTAQKALLNAFSTTLMTQLGRVLGNEMLCVQATNAKLKDRQARILAGQIDRLSTAEAHQLLSDLDWNLQAGLLVASGWTVSEALDALALERPLRELLRSR